MGLGVFPSLLLMRNIFRSLFWLDQSGIGLIRYILFSVRVMVKVVDLGFLSSLLPMQNPSCSLCWL